GSEMPAGGLTSNIHSVPVNTEMPGILVYPGDGATHLIGTHHKPPADILHPGEVRHDIMRTGSEEHFGRARELLRAAAAPGATVDENEDRRGLALSAVNIEPLDLGRSIREALGLADTQARQFAISDAAPD